MYSDTYKILDVFTSKLLAEHQTITDTREVAKLLIQIQKNALELEKYRAGIVESVAIQEDKYSIFLKDIYGNAPETNE